MTRSPLRANGKPASALRADAGFTLIEVIVAIVLIGASLLTVVGAAAAAFGFQAVARQQQVATTIATKKMEEIRALPFPVISGGMSAAALSGDPNLSVISRSPLKYGLARCGTEPLTSTETIPTGVATLPSGVLSPHRVTGGAIVDGIAYDWSAYITRPSIGDPYHATVCVTWTWKGAPRQTMIQSWVWSPQGPGCVGRPVSAVGGPCASVSATVPEGAVAIEIVKNNGTPIQLSFAIAGATSQIVLADKTVATASFTSSKAVGSSVFDERTLVTADDDDANSVASFADTLSVEIPRIGSATSPYYISPVTGFYVSYLAGTGQASASADPSGSQCQSTGFSAKNPVCAASGVNRAAGKWLAMFYDLGDGYWFAPLALTNSSLQFNFGTSAIAGGGNADARADRLFSLMRLGGLVSVPSAAPPGPLDNPTVFYPADLYASDWVALQSAPSACFDAVRNASCGRGAAAASSAATLCSAISRTEPSEGSTADLAYGCYLPVQATATSKTIRFDMSWSWTYTKGSIYDSNTVSPGVFPRTVRSTSPALDLKVRVVRTACRNVSVGATSCTGGNNPTPDVFDFQITLTLGAITVTYDKQL